MKYAIQTIVCGAYQENAYLLIPADENEKGCIVIDPGDDAIAIRNAIAASKHTLRAMYLTHGHFDHILAAEPISRVTGAPVYCHPADFVMLGDPSMGSYNQTVCSLSFPKALEALPYGDTIDLCGIHFQVLHTPGHSSGSVCLYDAENGVLFSGDTLFRAGFGRTDLYGGSGSQLRASLHRLFTLPRDVRVYPGHAGTTTIGTEMQRYGL